MPHNRFREALMRAYVAGWYAGRDGVQTGEGKIAVCDLLARLFPELDLPDESGECTISDYDRANVGEVMSDPDANWFGAKLLRLIATADEARRDRLRLAFPSYVEAWERWHFDSAE